MSKNVTLMHRAKYLSISYDKVTILDSQSWISVHVYVMQDWESLPLSVLLKRLTNGSTIDIVLKLEIVEYVMKTDGLAQEELGNKVVNFGTDDVSMFQGAHTSVTIQL